MYKEADAIREVLIKNKFEIRGKEIDTYNRYDALSICLKEKEKANWEIVSLEAIIKKLKQSNDKRKN